MKLLKINAVQHKIYSNGSIMMIQVTTMIKTSKIISGPQRGSIGPEENGISGVSGDITS